MRLLRQSCSVTTALQAWPWPKCKRTCGSPVHRERCHDANPPRHAYLSSVNSRMPCEEPSRELPLSLTPPKGASSVEIRPVLIHAADLGRPYAPLLAQQVDGLAPERHAARRHDPLGVEHLRDLVVQPRSVGDTSASRAPSSPGSCSTSVLRPPPAALPAHPAPLQRLSLVQLAQAAPDGAGRDPRRTRHRSDPAMARRTRLSGREQPAPPLIQVRRQQHKTRTDQGRINHPAKLWHHDPPRKFHRSNQFCWFSTGPSLILWAESPDWSGTKCQVRTNRRVARERALTRLLPGAIA